MKCPLKLKKPVCHTCEYEKEGLCDYPHSKEEKPKLGGDYNRITGVYMQSTARDRGLQEVVEIMEKCSMDTEFGCCYVRCDNCEEEARCVRLWLYMVAQSTNNGVRYITEPEFDIFILNFTLIQERLNNGHNGDGRTKWVKSDQLYSPQNQ